MNIKLVRHGQSMANRDPDVWRTKGDYAIDLSPLGREQAREAGKRLGPFLRDAVVYSSPYQRSRQTLAGICAGAGAYPPVYEDPRLREIDHGYNPETPQEAARLFHGRFYYRFPGGESPADCYDRISHFLESMMRQVERKRAEHVLIVTHSLTIRCFITRFLHLPVEEFDSMAGPDNCEVVTLAPKTPPPPTPPPAGPATASGADRSAAPPRPRKTRAPPKTHQLPKRINPRARRRRPAYPPRIVLSTHRKPPTVDPPPQPRPPVLSTNPVT